MAFGSQPWMSASAAGGAGGVGTGFGAMYIPDAYNSSGGVPDYNATNTLRSILFFEGPSKTFNFSGQRTDTSLANTYPTYNVNGASWTVSFWLRFPPHPGYTLYQNTYSNDLPQVVPNNYNSTAPEWVGQTNAVAMDILKSRTFNARGQQTGIETRLVDPSGFHATSLIEQNTRTRWGYSVAFRTGGYEDTGRYGNIQGVARGDWNLWQHIVISCGHDTWGSGVSNGSGALDQGLAVYVNGVRKNAQSAGAFIENYTGGHVSIQNASGLTAVPSLDFYGNSMMISNYYFVDGETLAPDDFRQTVGGSVIPKLYEGSLGNHGYHYAFETDYAVTRQGSDPLNMAVNEVTSTKTNLVQFVQEQVAQGEWDGGTFSAP